MKVYVIVGENRMTANVSARAAYSRREDAEAHLNDSKRMKSDDQAIVITLDVDSKLNLTRRTEVREQSYAAWMQ